MKAFEALVLPCGWTVVTERGGQCPVGSCAGPWKALFPYTATAPTPHRPRCLVGPSGPASAYQLGPRWTQEPRILDVYSSSMMLLAFAFRVVWGILGCHGQGTERMGPRWPGKGPLFLRRGTCLSFSWFCRPTVARHPAIQENLDVRVCTLNSPNCISLCQPSRMSFRLWCYLNWDENYI